MVDSAADKDLPLVSNVNEISVIHYMFNFSCSFKEKCFACHVALFLKPVVSSDTNYCNCAYSNLNNVNNNHSDETDLDIKANCLKTDMFMVILDCHKIIVEDVEEIHVTSAEKENFMYARYDPAFFCSKGKLNFITDKWSLKIWKDSRTCKLCFPKFIRISYKTVPEGPSLLWVTDQDKNPAVFTYGAWINNRSLFPCQEPPTAMATWEATVSVDNSAVVLMSGDEDAYIKSEDGRLYYYYFTKNILPLSTLCLAIGFWQEHQIMSKYRFGPKCRIFAPSSLLDKSVQELFEYAPYCLLISEDTFGPYPFPRIDFLIVPPTFGSLGMASPNIVFLSQSLLSGDSSLSSRIAHEIAHGWFGLLIGASDWTEEWLSEGFATFVEDYFHVRTLNMSDNEANDYIEVKTYIRLKTLLQELSNTDEDLQVLRPSKGETTIETVDGVNAAVLKNGQNPIKAFIQVHYIKGYFLLKHLCNIVSVGNFMSFLKAYIDKYRGKLITSKDFLTEFYGHFPGVQSHISIEEIYDNWLHNPGITDDLKDMKPSPINHIYMKTLKEVQKWHTRNSVYLKQKNKRKKLDFGGYDSLTPEQQILLLENMLDESVLSQHTLKDMEEFFNFTFANAEVQHRWFELVVKYKYKQSYEELKWFLTDHLMFSAVYVWQESKRLSIILASAGQLREHTMKSIEQAMGVYLFGEMLFSGDTTLRRMAKECYVATKNEMEPNYTSTVDQMLRDIEY